MFSYHTCVSSWECLSFSTEVDIFAEIVGGKEKFYYVDKDNKKIDYNQQAFFQGNKNSQGDIQCLMGLPQKYVSEMVEATCFGESKDKLKCILISNDEWGSVDIDLQQAETAMLRNAIFHLKGPLYVPDGKGSIINVGRNDSRNSFKDGFSKVYELTRAANIEDVIEKY